MIWKIFFSISLYIEKTNNLVDSFNYINHRDSMYSDDNKTPSKLTLDPSFLSTIKELSDKKILLPPSSIKEQFDFNLSIFPPEGELVTKVEEIGSFNLDPKKGHEVLNSNYLISAYDESINKYMALEGSAYFTSHSLVTLEKENYKPNNYLTFYFYTGSKKIVDNSNHIIYSEDPSYDSRKEYMKDKIKFLQENTPRNSILLVDGPLIGGDFYIYMIQSIKEFIQKDIIPIFFVKNSLSCLVTNTFQDLRYSYNSDLHWSHHFLKSGQRTNFFLYADKNNRKNAKVFCYLKAFDSSPQRVEFHVDTYVKNRELINDLLNLVYYLLLVQGDNYNPQVRPIAIAELYARETLKVVNLNRILQKSGITPTINQVRFGE